MKSHMLVYLISDLDQNGAVPKERLLAILLPELQRI